MPQVTLSGPIAEQILAKRGEAAEDKSPAPHKPAPKPTARSCSRGPLPTSSAEPRADGTFDDEDTEVLRRARGGTLNPQSLTARPVVLRPNNPSYPQVVVNSEGTWVRVSQPPGVQAENQVRSLPKSLDLLIITPTHIICQTKFGEAHL